MKKSIFILIVSLLSSHVSRAQFMAGGDTTICDNGLAQLWAVGGGASYYWTATPPDPTLFIPQTQNPIVSPNLATMYVCQTNIATGNLILNGSFEQGNTGFSSEYTYSPGSIVAEGTYAVVSDAHTVHSSFYCNQDHTTGNGLFMAINGSGVANAQVWYLTLPFIQPNTDYEFSTWITSLHSTNPALLQFSINGELLGQPFQAYSSTCDWYQFFEIWNSGPNTSATISIVNQNTILSGNDFALDDISFAEVEVFYDTVWVDVMPAYSSVFSLQSVSCLEVVEEVVYTGDAPDTADFQWDFGDGIVISGTGPGPYEVYWESTGTHEISLLVNPDACPSPVTINQIEVYDKPTGEVTADETYIPFGTTTFLHGIMTGNPGPLVFSWDPESKVQDPLSLDPETIPLDETTTFIFTVTDETTGCISTSEITVSVTGGPLGVGATAEPDQICLGETTQLHTVVSGGTGSYTYDWSSDPAGFNSSLPDPVVTPMITTTYFVDVNDGLSLVEAQADVTVNDLPAGNAGDDQMIPHGTSTTLNGSATGGSGSYAYHWEPADMLSDPNIRDPVTENLYQNTQFVLTVTDILTGCVDEEVSMIVNLEGGPLSVVIFGEDETCSGQTVTLTASCGGGNPSGYVYHWSDDAGNTYPAQVSIDVASSVTTTFYVTVDDGFNEAEGQFVLLVHPSPGFQLSENGTISACPYDSVILIPSTLNAGWSYLWSNGSTEQSIKVGSTGIGFDIQDYSLTVTSANECTITEEVTLIFDFAECLGVDDLADDDGWRIYPIPCRDMLFYKSSDHFKGQIRIYNIYGKLIYREDVDLMQDEGSSIEVHQLPRGIYLFMAAGSAGKHNRILVIL